MFFRQLHPFERNHTLPLSMNSLTYSSTDHQHSSTNSNNNYYYNTFNHSFDAHHSNLLPLNNSECNSYQNELRISQRRLPFRQPSRNPHQRFLSRTETKCPTHLTDKQKRKWIKAGQQAQQNQHLLSILNRFHWPQSNYDPIVHIHYRTSEFYLQGIIHKISRVRLYTIDTEADKPTPQFPNSLPALLQIQAVYEEKFSTVLLIEIQFLPEPSTELFQIIQTLCRMIFSSTNTIMAWGDVHKELRPLEQYNLFDLSQVTHVINLQDEFTNYWNKTHPHSEECLARHQNTNDELIDADILICLVNSADLEDEYDSSNINDDFNTCICSDELRPYKIKNSSWKLQKAIQYIFNQALDKSMTLNIWSCGLDLTLRTWQSTSDRITRQELTSYAINDVFAPTNLYFHIQSSSSPIQLDSIQPLVNHDGPCFLIITDSHGKYFPPCYNTQNYNNTTISISGLQWFNPYNQALCTRSLILSTSISNRLASCSGVVFLVGSNSIRNYSASQVIQQVEDIINLIQSQHVHLTQKHNISIVSAFPCFKLSSSFPTQEALSSNIDRYNYHLNQLSLYKNLTILNIPITPDQLSYDGLHIHVHYLSNIYIPIQQYFENIVDQQQLLTQRSQRSRAAKTRRNQKRHDKLRQRQRSQTVTRKISRIWNLHDLKAYLKHKNIKFSRLPEIRNHQLHIQFNHYVDQQHAENMLSFNEFDDNNYNNWISQKQ